MRISDWSSDVCSSDLDTQLHSEEEDDVNSEGDEGDEGDEDDEVTKAELSQQKLREYNEMMDRRGVVGGVVCCVAVIGCNLGDNKCRGKIGRASCRGRACQYV